jgi:NAD(P)-dependent dehydrogenase (short-subunit alcohol dehydrogenase family)
MNALVTGGSRGIGAATARRLAEHGWDVAVGYRAEAAAAALVVADIEAAGRRAIALPADVAVEADVVDLFAAMDRGLGRIDALVNNAGIVASRGPVADMDGERLERMMAVNVVGAFLCAREAVRRMARSRGGAGGVIVNVSSGAAHLGSPGEFVDYAASKAAVETMTIGLAREVGPEGIRVNAVRPGVIDTEIHGRAGQPDKADRLAPTVPLGRAGRPDEVAAAIAWLCSGEASYVNGAILDVAGGR